MLEFNATILFAMVSFVIFMFLMNIVLYKPVQEIVEKRRNLIALNDAEIDENNKKTGVLTAEKESKFDEARISSRVIIAKTTDEAKSEKAKIIAEATHKAQENLITTKQHLLEEVDTIKHELNNEVVDLAQSILSKVSGQQIVLTNVDEKEINEALNNGV